MSYKLFQQQTQQILSTNDFLKTFTDASIQELSTSIKSDYSPDDYVCAQLFKQSLLNAVNLSVQQSQEPIFPTIEAPLPRAVRDASYTNIVPLQMNTALKTLKASQVVQQINVPNIVGSISSRPGSKAQVQTTADDQLKTELKKFYRPPSAQEVRFLAKDINSRQKLLKQTKLDVKTMNASRKGEILDQLNALQKGNKKLSEFPDNGQIVVDSTGKVVGVGGVKQMITQIQQGDCKIIKKDTKKKDKAPTKDVKDKDEESPFNELNRKYEENLLKTQNVLKK